MRIDWGLFSIKSVESVARNIFLRSFLSCDLDQREIDTVSNEAYRNGFRLSDRSFPSSIKSWNLSTSSAIHECATYCIVMILRSRLIFRDKSPVQKTGNLHSGTSSLIAASYRARFGHRITSRYGIVLSRPFRTNELTQCAHQLTGYYYYLVADHQR